MNKALLYVGTACHLCDYARELVEAVFSNNEWTFIEVNINSSQVLREKYGESIPVISFPSGAEKGWPFTKNQLTKMLTEENKLFQ